MDSNIDYHYLAASLLINVDAMHVNMTVMIEITLGIDDGTILA